MNRLSFYNLSSFLLLLFGLISGIMGIYFMGYNYVLFLDWEFLSINSCCMVMTLLFDWMSLIFLMSVLFISSMVVYYSSSYMQSDFYSVRFLWLVLLFVFSMVMMIMSPNLISILIGWDGLGLVSYCLVIYYQNNSSYGAGMLTILTNRIGDVSILLCISWFMNFGSWNFIYYVCIWEDWMFNLVLLLILAGFTSSAQIPFSSWLPAAMAAPTPVSALVHSSTLVTAGVYLLIRFNNLFLNIDCYLLVLLSMMTMFMSGLGASFEFDLKKIIALSTLSQLGLMMSILFMGFPVLAFFHLLTHAFFKALLFLCAGLIIHCMSDTQDIRHMGGIVNYLPFTCSCFCISSLSLCGLPFLSGFYSKDLILELFTLGGSNLVVYIIFYFSVGLTVAYSTRLIYYCMSDGHGMYVCQSYFEDKNMMFSMILLTMLSIMSGSALCWLIFSTPSLVVLSFSLKMAPLFFILLGGWLGYELSIFMSGENLFSVSFYVISYFSGFMWFMPKFSTYMLYSDALYLSSGISENVDMGWGEVIVSTSFVNYFSYLGQLNQFIQNNNIKLFMISYLFILFILLI
uniref:NADH-ubiquinone oxidoreductase chain 5 n=1 Tax=Ilyocoris cimicoides TaxID=280203 RepID=C5HIS0_9HEMI|nr:NADH dehydrogenase subunit 5 [Ilyocoris cimicoides]ACJ69515.1 NADH dehydrogenase subunit 5 [Ilyocoris cimicoides]